MTRRATWAVAVAAALAGTLTGPAASSARQLPPRSRPAFRVAVSKPLMGENYDAVSGTLDVEARIPRWRDGGIILQGSMAYSTSGLARSTTLGNPALGVWGRPLGVPVELQVTLPLRREGGDDDFATDLAYLSDPIHRERWIAGRWGASVAYVPDIVFRDGSSADLRLGAVALAPKGEVDGDVRARVVAGLGLRFSPSVQAGGRFSGTFRMTGSGGFDQRTQNDLAVFVRLPWTPGRPELSFRLPIDIDLQDYVSGVIALRMAF